MRTASLCFARLSRAPNEARLSSRLYRSVCSRPRLAPQPSRSGFSSAATAFKRKSGPSDSHGSHREPDTTKTAATKQPVRLLDPSTEARRFNKFLPVRLRIGQDDASLQELEPNVDDILGTDVRNRKEMEQKTDVYLWMIEHGHKHAVVSLFNATLKGVASRKQTISDGLPSNIAWPNHIFDDLEYEAVDVDRHDLRSASISTEHDDQFLSRSASLDGRFMRHTWTTLARIVLRAADVDSDVAQDYMSTAQLILSTLHNLEMVPNEVYTYTTSSWSSYIKKPPILHLVSSRILTALSDAKWRAQQNDAIAQATALGMSLKEISESVPGGRFRLKVRPLAPEIWLEFILWCCVHGGYWKAATDIIIMLSKSENPWFAVRWCSTHSTQGFDSFVDWDRLKLRHGGSVGLIEGYSREKPFVEVPERTVSVEVVLALVDGIIDNEINTQPSMDKETALKTLRPHMNDVRSLIQFLEPHDLPSSYFDYLESRLLQTDVLDVNLAPSLLQRWSMRVADVRKLETIREPATAHLGLELESILDNGLLENGVQHQALDRLVQAGALHNALVVFNDCQELTDQKKVKSITEFLQPQTPPEKSFFTSRTHKHHLEYAGSHGQIPYYRLAAFLNVVSDAKLAGLGEWLLFSSDWDGALLPEAAYESTCMFPALLKFASLTKDATLRSRVQAAINQPGRKLSVRTLRALLDSAFIALDLHGARQRLDQLRIAQAGGVGLGNIAQLAVVILKLENAARTSRTPVNTQQHAKATRLMAAILQGQFNCIRGDFTLSQRRLFNQCVSHLLRIFADCDGSVLQRFAKRFAQSYISGNQVSLPAKVFNVLLNGIAETRGAIQARKVFELFCQEPGTEDGHYVYSDPLNEELYYDEDVPEATTRDSQAAQPSTPGENASERSMAAGNSLTEATDLDFTDAQPTTFVDSFFTGHAETDSNPVGEGSIVAPAIESGSSQSSPQADASATDIDAYLTPMQVTVANLSTLRTIVSVAVVERDTGELETSSEGRDVISWALRVYRRLGVLDPDILSQEIRQPVSQLDIPRPEARVVRRPLVASKASPLWAEAVRSSKARMRQQSGTRLPLAERSGT